MSLLYKIRFLNDFVNFLSTAADEVRSQDKRDEHYFRQKRQQF